MVIQPKFLAGPAPKPTKMQVEGVEEEVEEDEDNEKQVNGH